MPGSEQNLGKLLSTHATSTVFLQRAAIIAAVSFVFFLAMLLVFYVRQHIGYFVLSTAFLVVYIFTLIGWVMARRTIVSIYENGIKYRKFRSTWDEIEFVRAGSSGVEIRKNKNEKTTIPSSVDGFEAVVRSLKNALNGDSSKARE